jgi:hypothetical protein
MLKNIVFNEVEKIREIKKKPKLKEVLIAFSKYKNNPKGKNFIIDKLHALYSNDKNIQIQHDEDPKFNRLIGLLNRIHKVSSYQFETIREIEIKLQTLLQRRKYREDNRKSYMAELVYQKTENRKAEEAKRKKDK